MVTECPGKCTGKGPVKLWKSTFIVLYAVVPRTVSEGLDGRSEAVTAGLAFYTSKPLS